MKTLRTLALAFVTVSSIALAADGKSLPRATPESQGVSSAALLGLIDEAEAKINALHSVMIVRRGRVIAEGWWAPYGPQEPHQMFSLSKSFTSTAVGLAIAEGKFSLDDPVLKFFPEDAPAQPSANLRAMRVRDLLTMATGHHTEDIAGFPYNDDAGAVRKFLALPVAHKPGTFFVYNTPATFMASAIVQKTTGQTVLDYLRPRLFAPLGMADPTWEANKQGISMGGTGLSIRTEDIAKLGQLYLQKGKWDGQQLVPAAWTEIATARWQSNGSNPASDWEQGYGFQFWRCRHGAIRGDGAHGQFCVMLAEQETVVAITAGTRDLQGVLNVLWAKLLPALQNKTALPADAAAHAQLKTKLASLSLKHPVAIAPPAIASEIAGRNYVFPKNPLGLESVALATSTQHPGGAQLTTVVGGKRDRVELAPGSWEKGEVESGPLAGPVAISGAWTAADTFTVEVVRYRTPFVLTHRLKFAGDEVTLELRPNVGNAIPAIKGRRE
jgi:CubicO group peptidase (beta-lactamase class C family)